MQFNIKIAALLAVLVAPHALGQTLYSISYDTSYDTASTPTASAMCGSQLTSEGYATYGSIPTFPSLGGSANITGPDSALCSQCVVFEFAGNFAGVKLINSAGGSGWDFVISEEAMNTLTNNVTIYPHVNARIVQGPYSC